MDTSVVLYPAMAVSHVVPMVQFAKLLLSHGLTSTIVIPTGTFHGSDALDSYISTVTSSQPSITFHRLPSASLPPDDTISHTVRVFRLLRLTNPLLLSYLTDQAPNARALVLDFFCTDALDVAAELGIPSFYFFSSSASTLAAFLHLPTLHSRATASFGDLGDAPLHFPGLPAIPASHLPKQLLDNEDGDGDGKELMYQFARLPLADGIIANTLKSLEEPAVAAISAGLCVPDRPAAAPPVYCVGPVIAVGEGEKHECLAWLDSQPCGSVLFLCFGSRGSFSDGQVREIAVGLERSGLRFLWVLRGPPGSEEAELPEGFLERTAERGMVVRSWAPQVAVLGHEAVAGFVTHCGWNSVMEAVANGVAMIAWPLYAEQKMNKVFLVEEMKLAVEMRGYDKGVVGAEEVEERVRWLMESEEGREMRERAAGVKESAAAAMAEGGESNAALAEWVAVVKRGRKD